MLVFSIPSGISGDIKASARLVNNFQFDSNHLTLQ